MDSSSLIDLMRFTPIDIYPTVWGRLESLINEHRLMAPVQVLHEIKRGNDTLANWACTHKKMFHSINQDVLLAVKQILEKYPSLAKRRDEADADAFIIGLAISITKPTQQRFTSSETIVVTEEKLKNNKVVIPFVCKQYELKYLPYLGMFRAEGWQF